MQLGITEFYPAITKKNVKKMQLTLQRIAFQYQKSKLAL